MVKLLITSDIAKKCEFKTHGILQVLCCGGEMVKMLITSDIANYCELKLTVYFRCCTVVGKW